MHISSLLYVVCLITTCVGSVATNILLLILIASHRKLRTETWVLTLNLTISDLILAITIIPSSIYSLFGGSVLTTDIMVCRLAAFLFVLLQLSSLHSLTWMTIDKFTEIGFPLHYAQLFTGRRTWLIISGLWIYCTLTAALPFMGFGRYAYNENANICAPKFGSSTKAYSMLLLILGMIIPLMVICVLYISIVHIAKHQARRGTFVCNEHHCYYVPIRPYFRNTVLLVSSALYLVVCWIPYTTTSFFDIFQEEVVPSLVEKISTWLILFTSVLNPWLTSLGQKHPGKREARMGIYHMPRTDAYWKVQEGNARNMEEIQTGICTSGSKSNPFDKRDRFKPEISPQSSREHKPDCCSHMKVQEINAEHTANLSPEELSSKPRH